MEFRQKTYCENPREKASAISVLFFLWTYAIFQKGYSKLFGIEDLCAPLKNDRSETVGNNLQASWEQEIKDKRKRKSKATPSLLKALYNTFKIEFFYLGIVHILKEIVLGISRPWVLGIFLSYFKVASTTSTETAAYAGAALVTITFFNSLLNAHYNTMSSHIGLRMRAAVCSLVFRKCLKLDMISTRETAPGQIVNLVSNDVSRFDLVTVTSHFMWSSPIITLMVTYIIYEDIGNAAFFGLAAAFCVIPLQSYAGKITCRYRMSIARKTDIRVRLMDEVIAGIQVIKMYAWEKPFTRLVNEARKTEIGIVQKTSYLRGLYMTFNLFTTRMALFCTLTSFIFFGGKLSTDRVFVVAAYFNLLAHTMCGMFVRGFAEICEAFVSIRRLQNFLLLTEHEPRKIDCVHPHGKGHVLLDNVTAQWSLQNADLTLNAVSIYVKPKQLVCVIGSIGAGKTSLLHIILNELRLSSGRVSLGGTVSYASQEPWIFAATIRQNILFGLPYIRRRYAEVIRVCALQDDLDCLPNGDFTVVGERGASLSGGQKARINLARAVYKNADIYLLDDPLSAVDMHVGKHLFEDCISGFLKDKTRILVTHQLQYLNHVDQILFLNNGVLQASCNFANLKQDVVEYTNIIANSVSTCIENNNRNSKNHIGNNLEMSDGPGLQPLMRLMSQSSIKSLKSVQCIDDTASICPDPEDCTDEDYIYRSANKTSVYCSYFSAGTNMYILFGCLVLFAVAQIIASLCDYWVSYWATREEYRQFDILKNNTAFVHLYGESTFFKIVNSTMHSHVHLLSTESYIAIYSALIISLFIAGISRATAFYSACMRCSKGIHKKMFEAVVHSPLAFFNANPSGRILNRFSKDMGAVDEVLPKAMLDAAQGVMQVSGALIVSLSVNPLFSIPVMILLYLFWRLSKAYLRTSKSLKYLEGVTRSPVFTHLNACLHGLPTIRAHGAAQTLIEEFDYHQDLHSSTWHLFVYTNMGFAYLIDFLCLLYLSTILISFFFFADIGGKVGLAVTQTMTLMGVVQWAMRQAAEVENHMISVKRLVEYTRLEPESNVKPDYEVKMGVWPVRGKVEFKSVSVRYLHGPRVIRNLNIEIQPKEKIGIVGRTGAGKSSLIAALFRLAEVEGVILIDERNCQDVPLNCLRSNISIIPQDPVLFSGTLRKNLDPFEQYPDYVLWTALQEVELKDMIMEGPGLNMTVYEGGSNFSVGQRQLICLARAIVRNNVILVLDEATANVDPKTDLLIQSTIRKKFADCTVLTIAHRLYTIMDSDKVLVMDSGEAVEYGHPGDLLSQPSGFFKDLVNETGPNMSQDLIRIAMDRRNTNSPSS